MNIIIYFLLVWNIEMKTIKEDRHSNWSTSTHIGWVLGSLMERVGFGDIYGKKIKVCECLYPFDGHI